MPLNDFPNLCHVTPSQPGCDRELGPQNQPDVLSYHTGREIENYWTYARQFVLQDAMFALTDSWTLPAYLYLVSGWSASCDGPWKPMSCRSDIDLLTEEDIHRYGEPAVYAWTDITYLLHEHDVSWAYYVGDGTCIEPPCTGLSGPATLSSRNPLPGFTDVKQTGQILNIRRHADYLAAAAEGTLPSVSWIVPAKFSDHPGNETSVYHGRRA